MRRVLLGILRGVASIVSTVLAFGCVLVVLLAIALVFVWLLLR